MLTTCFVALPPWVRCKRSARVRVPPRSVRWGSPSIPLVFDALVASRLLWIASGSMARPQVRLVLTFIGGRRESERRTVIWRVRPIRWATSIGGKGADAKGGMAAGGHPSFK